MVLQGKSRAAIVKELQRTGLDVNEAVNNLLSRDDDEGEEEGDSLVVSGDDVVSWFDSGQYDVFSWFDPRLLSCYQWFNDTEYNIVNGREGSHPTYIN